MRFVFTERFLFLLAIGLIPITLSPFVPFLKTAALAYDLLLFALAAWDFFSSPPLQGLEVLRAVDPNLMVGEPNLVTITARNHLGMERDLLIKDEPPLTFQLDPPRALFSLELLPRSSGQARYTVLPLSRGDFRFGDLHVRASGRLKLVARQGTIPTSFDVRVYPNVNEMGRYALLQRKGHLERAGVRALKVKGEGREFESLREYIPGDDHRRINWKATAKRGKPITQAYEIERSQNVMLLLDAGRMMTAQAGRYTKLDGAINAALMLAYVATRQGDKVGLLVFADQVLAYLPPRRGMGQLQRILLSLYGVVPALTEPDYRAAFRHLTLRHLQRSLIVIFTDLIDARASSRLLTYVASLVPRHLPLLVAIGDPDILEVAEGLPKAAEEVYRQAVAVELLREREEALKGLLIRGALALDVSPEELTVGTINKYLEVKQRGLL